MKAATGEEVSAEDLGGADLHCRLTLYFKYLDLNVCFFSSCIYSFIYYLKFCFF